MKSLQERLNDAALEFRGQFEQFYFAPGKGYAIVNTSIPREIIRNVPGIPDMIANHYRIPEIALKHNVGVIFKVDYKEVYNLQVKFLDSSDIRSHMHL